MIHPARTFRFIARLSAVLCIALSLTACNENTTNDAPTDATGGTTATSQRNAHNPTPAELAAQTEAYAKRLEQQQHAPSPYPATPRLTDQQPAKPKVQWIDPQTAPADQTPPAPTVTNTQATEGATDHATAAPAALSREELIKRLASDLKPASPAQAAAVRPWIQRASLAVIDPSYELSSDDMKSLSADDRRLVLAWQRTFAQLGRSLSADDKANRSTLIDLADELVSQIQQQRSLSVAALKLCTSVNGYGVYEAIPKPVFLAGSEHPVIVYAELDHFQTKLNDNKQHVVQLSQEMVLYNDADGLPVWRQRPVAINDVSANKRRDFFTVQVIHLSDRLSVGKYILKLRVTDEIGSTVAESSLPLQIVADPKMVSGK